MSTEPLTPTTDAGRRVLAALEAVDATNPKAAEAPIGWWQAVVAIELEARQQGLDAARAAQDVTGREREMDREAHDDAVRAEHEATHGEAEMCGADCIALGLTEFDDAQPVTPSPDALREAAKRGTEQWKGCIVHGRAPDEMPCIDCDAERVGLERKPGQWAFLDTETGDWFEVKPGVVWGEALRDAV